MWKTILSILGVALLVVAAIQIWVYFHPTKENHALQQQYQVAQDTIAGAQKAIKSTQDSLHIMRDSVLAVKVQRDAWARQAAAAVNKADTLRKQLTAAPTDSTDPAWMHRALNLEDQNVELRLANAKKDSVALADSLQMDVYTSQIRKDSIALAYANGALAVAHSAVTKAQHVGKLFGLIPLPSRTQSFVYGAITVIAIEAAPKLHGKLP